MKKIYGLAAAVLLLAACKHHQPETLYFSGTYVAEEKTPYTLADDTLVIRGAGGDTYRLKRRLVITVLQSRHVASLTSIEDYTGQLNPRTAVLSLPVPGKEVRLWLTGNRQQVEWQGVRYTKIDY